MSLHNPFLAALAHFLSYRFARLGHFMNSVWPFVASLPSVMISGSSVGSRCPSFAALGAS